MGINRHGGFQCIGTSHEKAPLILEQYLSYDEMQIAGLHGVSVPRFFINNRQCDNAYKKGKMYMKHNTFMSV